MDCNDITKVLIAGYLPLVGVIVWLIRTGRKDWVRFIKITERCIDALERVEKLLTNWRGH